MSMSSFREALVGLQARGLTEVGIDAILNYLARVPEGAPTASRQFSEQAALAQLEINASHRRARIEEHTNFNRFAIDTGQSAIRTAMLTNGAAAVAMLAFVGNAWVKGMPEAPMLKIGEAMLWFSVGVLTAAVASGLAYLVQRAFLEGFDLDGSREESRITWNRVGAVLNVVAIVAVVGTYGCFGRGVWVAYGSMKLLAKAASVTLG